MIYYWIEHGVIQARRLTSGTPYWITVSETDEQKLWDWVRKFNRLRHATAGFTTRDVMDTGFAIICPLARHRRPPIRFLFISSRLCSTLLSGPASRRVLFHLCASLTLHPPTGWVEELHLLAVEHARHAKVKPGFLRSSPSLPRRFAYLWG